DYQIVGNQRLDYSDRVTVARLLGGIAAYFAALAVLGFKVKEFARRTV
ncbi:hypothetical protein ACUOA8_27660, partial [Escherichia sp. SS-MK2]